MPHIEVLDQITIDKIAAGEVVERPASVVKELTENAVDAGSDAITVEIEEGGISLIRVSDNGCGINKNEVRDAFLRHSTSKIRSDEDLMHISTLGFRGEALSSISAVSMVEMITKQKEDLLGTKYTIEGGKEKGIEEVGAPDGTTFMVRQLFYNTPARRKFLKTPMTEAAHINDIMMRLSLSHPEVSFKFLTNGQLKIHTSGNGKLKDVIYHIYGREIAANLIPVKSEFLGMEIEGYLGKPVISRGNRNYENFFINGRYVKSNIISKAIEDGYKDYTMQHRYPFVVLQFHLSPEDIDVNVHPSKMELRFGNQQRIYNFVYDVIRTALQEPELIPEVELEEEKKIPVNHESIKQDPIPPKEERNLDYFMEKMKARVESYHNQNSQAEVTDRAQIFQPALDADKIKTAVENRKMFEKTERTLENNDKISEKTEHTLDGNTVKEPENSYKTERTPQEFDHINNKTEHAFINRDLANGKPEQLNLFEENVLEKDIRQEYKIIGQVFDTYWMIEFDEKLYIIDQHAAHERVLYEKTMRGLKNREYTSQYLNPPIILTLSMQEVNVLKTYMDRFTAIGFEFEEFGGNEYAVRAIPDNLFGIAKKDLLLEMIDDLADGIATGVKPDLIDHRIATMSCKAAVKGNNKLSYQEVETLISELLQLDNPYHCPHGRPTIITMTKRELEKKFKRIV